MLLHCDGHLDPFDEGLRQALAGYCHNDEDCPDSLTVEAILSEEVGCDHPWLREAGPAPPFAAMCAGEVPPAEDLHAACEALVACPAGEGLPSVELCAVSLGVRDDVWELTPCLLDAEGCPQVHGCLE